MKKLYSLIVMAILGAAVANAAIAYQGETFVPEDWTYAGRGTYEPGIFDYYGNEWPLIVDCKFYTSNTTEGVYWVEPIQPEDLNIEEYLAVAGNFILHTENPNQVWTTPIWTLNPMVFCFYQMVPEVLGMQGSAAYYGKLDNFRVTFPASSYILATMPTGTPTTNNEGMFAINIPDPAGISAVDTDNTPATYYNLQGVEVANPAPSKVYIKKQGAKAIKVIF